jgi:hypothetical protein
MPTPKFSSTYQPKRKPAAFLTKPVSFHCTPELYEDLLTLSRHVQRHPPSLCRDALRQYLDYYKAHPEELERG